MPLPEWMRFLYRFCGCHFGRAGMQLSASSEATNKDPHKPALDSPARAQESSAACDPRDCWRLC